MKRLIAAGVAVGAALAFFFDPKNGTRRRHEFRDRFAAVFRHTGKTAGQFGESAKSSGYALKQKATNMKDSPPKEQPDDVTLARKVETEIFRDPEVPKGDININAENGVVFLRGAVNDESLIEALAESARKVQGVREVENLLHVSGTPAPTKQA
jgi:osmotically-inducible protein OsmY